MTTISSRFNPARVSELRAALQAHCDRGDIPGLVALIARGGDVHVEVLGTQQAGGSAVFTDFWKHAYRALDA
jgi:hypothetical protein